MSEDDDKTWWGGDIETPAQTLQHEDSKPAVDKPAVDNTVPFSPSNREQAEAAMNNIESTSPSDAVRGIADDNAADKADSEWAETPEGFTNPDFDESQARAEEAEWGGGAVNTPTADTTTETSDPSIDAQWGPQTNAQNQATWNDIDSTPAGDLARDNSVEGEQDWAATPQDWSDPNSMPETGPEETFDY